jgi:hypothetical protein
MATPSAPANLPPVAVFGSAFAVVVTVAFADGGYFRETWGWTAVAPCMLGGIALLLREQIAVGRFELGTIGAMAALVSWVALSAAWSASPTASAWEAERGLIYVSALLAFPLVVQPEQIRELIGGLTAGAAVIAAYSLGARLFPSEPVAMDPVEGTLLIEPLGYANALGILAAMGALLSLGFAAHGRARLTRALGAAGPIVLLPTLTLTESRAAGLALGVGLGVWALVETQRSKLLTSTLVVALPALIAVWVTARSSALTDSGATVDQASDAGRRVALVIGLLALAAGLGSLRSAWIEARVSRARRPRMIPVAIALVLLSAVVVAVLGTERSLGLRADYWRVAWNEFHENAWLGSGAGTFAEYWQRSGVPTGASDAHSLYLETLAELGPFGLTLLLMALGIPLVAALRTRDRRLVGVAMGAYSAYLVHAGLDWDWEMPAVTLTALLCAVALLAAARPDGVQIVIERRVRIGWLLATLVVAALALSGQLAS